jgi:membrane-bound metal-dependent hydrolase YbcI (DUF457 family)
MSDSLFHFLFPVICALAVRVHVKHPVRNILLAGFLTVLIDLDHLSFLGPARGLLHNMFVTTIIPYILVVLTFYFRRSYQEKGFAILLSVFLPSHTFLDLAFGGGVMLFYPFSQVLYSLNFNLAVAEGYLVSAAGLALLFYFVSIIAPLYFLDRLIEKSEKQHETIRKAFKELFKPKK